MRRILPLLFALLLGSACGSDNASPETHGAHNKPSDGGATKSTAAAPGNPDAPPQPAGAQGTYGESGATPGGQQRAPQK
ncbi:MAG: hypothetical protein M3Q69_10360 [Acidobacteriota bacterium]|nr:hypothetical protein [Acidobacteriota bacterium]